MELNVKYCLDHKKLKLSPVLSYGTRISLVSILQALPLYECLSKNQNNRTGSLDIYSPRDCGYLSKFIFFKKQVNK